VSDLTRNLNILSRSCGALETVIFEKNTFLLVAKSSVDEPENDSLMVKHNVSEEATSGENAAVQATKTAGPVNRFELITKLIKTFKNDSRKHSSETFESLRMEVADFTLVLESLTATSYVLVIASNDEPRISKVTSTHIFSSSSYASCTAPEAIALNIASVRARFETLQIAAK
jgi:Ras-related GTP-binding protein A/B